MKTKRQTIFIIGTILILTFAIWKAFFWIGYKDEPLYFTLSLQMIKGETLFTEIWGILGFQGLLLYPLIKIYILLTGSVDGIMLCFRFIYIIVHFLVGIIIYKRLEKYSSVAHIAVWMFLLFNPMNHQLLSYNSIPFLFGFLGVVLLATSKNRIIYYLCGILFACSVLLQPVLGLEFFAISIIFFIVSRKNIKESIKKYLLFVLGCVTAAIPVVFYLVKYTGINKFISFLPYNIGLKEDVVHPQGGIVGLFKYYFWSVFPDQKIIGSFGTGIISALILALIFVLFVIQIIKNVQKKQDGYLIIRLMIIGCVAYSIICAIATMQLPTTVNMFPWIFVGIASYGICQNAFIRKLFRISIIWTIIYGIALLSSDSGMKTLSISIFSTVLVIVMMINDIYTNNIKLKRKRLIVAFSISLACMIIIGASYPLKTINNIGLAKEGPSKNIRDTKKIANRYNEIMDDMKEINSNKKPTLILSSFVHAYMAYEGNNTQYSAFFNHFGKTPMNRLKGYYKIYPDKKPQLLYITYDDLKKNSLDDICRILEFDINNKKSLKAGYLIKK